LHVKFAHSEVHVKVSSQQFAVNLCLVSEYITQKRNVTDNLNLLQMFPIALVTRRIIWMPWWEVKNIL